MADAARIQRDVKGTVVYLGQVRKQGALRVQAATPARLRRAMANLSRADLAHRPAPGKWSIKEIICHLADVEVVNGWRYRMILAQSGSTVRAEGGIRPHFTLSEPAAQSLLRSWAVGE